MDPSASTTSRLDGKNIVLGVAGGIAAYKACDLASKLVQEKATVTTILTRHARKFVTPYTFEALTGRTCLTGNFKRVSGSETPYPHIDFALDADLIVIAPATANLIARLAHGMADELLPTLCLSARCPIVICPAMNVQMWEHPATQQNIQRLIQYGYQLLGPDKGSLACGMVGAGRLVEPAEILKFLCELLSQSQQKAAPGASAKGRNRRSKHGGGRKPKGKDSGPRS